MSKLDDEFVIIHSELSGKMEEDGTTIDVQIYRGEHEKTWLLEVIDEEGASIVWDKRFETDRLALAEVARTIDVEGMETFAVNRDKTVH